MDSTSNTYKEKDDMKEKIIYTMIPFSIIIVILFTLIFVLYRTSQAKQLLIQILYFIFGTTNEKFTNWVISIIAITSFIGFFYALAFFPKDFQQIIFNNVVFEKTGDSTFGNLAAKAEFAAQEFEKVLTVDSTGSFILNNTPAKLVDEVRSVTNNTLGDVLPKDVIRAFTGTIFSNERIKNINGKTYVVPR